MLSNDGQRTEMGRISLLLQWDISDYSKSVGSRRDKTFVNDVQCVCEVQRSS